MNAREEIVLSFLRSSISFSIESSGAPRDLHSFPTRRSSDLVLAFDPQDANILYAGGQGGLFAITFSAPVLLSLSDRKSTRLNSSHVSISYAVFCLKKKTTSVASTDAYNLSLIPNQYPQYAAL